jgi:CrcB protein
LAVRLPPDLLIIGAAVIGVLAGLVASEKLPMAPHARTFIFVGILGGFTTFSSFMLDTSTLGHGSEPVAASLNVLGQNAAGVALVWAGYTVAVTLH